MAILRGKVSDFYGDGDSVSHAKTQGLDIIKALHYDKFILQTTLFIIFIVGFEFLACNKWRLGYEADCLTQRLGAYKSLPFCIALLRYI